MARFPLFALDCVCCPLCHSSLHYEQAAAPGQAAWLRCESGHCFDVARAGYVNFLAGRARVELGDSRAMVAARSRFMDRQHFAPLAKHIEQTAAHAIAAGPCVRDRRPATARRIIDVGAGPAYYLARALDGCGAYAIAVDASKHAARLAARAHAHIAAVVAQASSLPLRTGSIDIALSAFAPRDEREIRRVLVADGHWIVVTPDRHHLRELVAPLGLLRVDPRKRERLETRLNGLFRCERRSTIEVDLRLTREEANDLVAMTPSARHVGGDEIVEQLATFDEPIRVTAAFVVETLRRCPG